MESNFAQTAAETIQTTNRPESAERFRGEVCRIAGTPGLIHWFNIYTEDGKTVTEWAFTFPDELSALRVAWAYKIQQDLITVKPAARGGFVVSKRTH